MEMNVAFIPVRGGSKSIPHKNIKPFCGKPLVYWTAKAAVESKYIDKVYVSTDDEKIRETVLGFCLDRVEVIGRSNSTATDEASTESAMLEFARGHDFEHIALIQATSPLLRAEDIDRGFECLKDADSVLSVVRQKRFVWKDEGNESFPVNYDYMNRPRRQQFDGYLVENGAFYITGKDKLLESGCRLSGKIRTVEMPEYTYYEIDEPSDWIIAEALLKARKTRNADINVRMFVADCDGTLTDGGMYYSAEGDCLKKFNTRDGVGFRLLSEKGIITGIITNEDSEIVKRRREKLKLDFVKTGISNKLSMIKELCAEYEIDLSEVAYIGDDLNDMDVMKNVGLSFCPSDAVDDVKSIANVVLSARGGGGAVREATDWILGSFYPIEYKGIL